MCILMWLHAACELRASRVCFAIGPAERKHINVQYVMQGSLLTAETLLARAC